MNTLSASSKSSFGGRMPVDSMETGREKMSNEPQYTDERCILTDEVVFGPGKLDLLIPAFFPGAFSAHGTISWIFNVGLACTEK